MAYKPGHIFKKRKGLPKEEEIQEAGKLIAALSGGSIPPSVDDLIFVVPSQAREHKTLGIFREEKVEAMHNIVNALSRRPARGGLTLRQVSCVRY